MASKVYTAQEMRALAESKAIVKLHCKSGNLLPRCREWCPADDAKKCQDADDIRAALRYAAEMVERANERRGMFAVNYGRVDYEHDDAIVDEIDYILSGDDGKGEK